MKTAAEESMEDAKAYYDPWKAAEAREKALRERAEQAERALAERDALIADLRGLLRPLCLNVHHSVHIAAVDLEPDCTCWGCSAWRRVEALTPTAASALAAAEQEVVEAVTAYMNGSASYGTLKRALTALAALKAKEVGDGAE